MGYRSLTASGGSTMICRTGWTSRDSTYAKYETFIRSYLVPSLGRKRLDRLTPVDVREFLNRSLFMHPAAKPPPLLSLPDLVTPACPTSPAARFGSER